MASIFWDLYYLVVARISYLKFLLRFLIEGYELERARAGAHHYTRLLLSAELARIELEIAELKKKGGSQ